MSKEEEIEKVKTQAFEEKQKALEQIENAKKEKQKAEEQAAKAQKDALEKVKKSESQTAEQIKKQEAAIKAKYEQDMLRLNRESAAKMEQLEKSKKVFEDSLQQVLEKKCFWMLNLLELG